jgi:hypothetical protein
LSLKRVLAERFEGQAFQSIRIGDMKPPQFSQQLTLHGLLWMECLLMNHASEKSINRILNLPGTSQRLNHWMVCAFRVLNGLFSGEE